MFFVFKVIIEIMRKKERKKFNYEILWGEKSHTYDIQSYTYKTSLNYW